MKVCYPLIAAVIESPVIFLVPLLIEGVPVELKGKLSGEFFYQQKGCLPSLAKISFQAGKNKITGEIKNIVSGFEITYSTAPLILKVSHTVYNKDGLSFKLGYETPLSFTGTLGLTVPILEDQEGILSFEGKLVVEAEVFPGSGLVETGAGLISSVNQGPNISAVKDHLKELLTNGQLAFSLARLSQVSPVMASQVRKWIGAVGHTVLKIPQTGGLPDKQMSK